MTYRIAEAAGIVGVPATTLRYYETIGLIDQLARGGNGYRSYDDGDLARLRFITATKNLGIPLTDVAELVKAFDAEDCSTVAHQVVEMVAVRLAETQNRIGELTALAEQLRSVSARLAQVPAAGPCGAGCPCATAAPDRLVDRHVLLPLARLRACEPVAAPVVVPVSIPAIACSLDGATMGGRVAQWRALAARAVRREPLTGGLVLVFRSAPDLVGEVAGLAAAEQRRRPSFTFILQLTTDELRLQVRAPSDAAGLIEDLFGTA